LRTPSSKAMLSSATMVSLSSSVSHFQRRCTVLDQVLIAREPSAMTAHCRPKRDRGFCREPVMAHRVSPSRQRLAMYSALSSGKGAISPMARVEGRGEGALEPGLRGGKSLCHITVAFPVSR
jgi:hypothetical protein